MARYHVRLEGRDEPLVVEVVADDGDRVEVLVGDRRMELRLTTLPDGSLLTSRGGRLARVDVLPSRDGVELLYGDRSVRARVVDERDTWLSMDVAADGGGAVTVAMPGKVVAIDVAVGDAVERGQRLLVIEAMKMENDVKSPRAGVVSSIRVAVGERVEAGTVLVEME